MTLSLKNHLSSTLLNSLQYCHLIQNPSWQPSTQRQQQRSQSRCPGYCFPSEISQVEPVLDLLQERYQYATLKSQSRSLLWF